MGTELRFSELYLTRQIQDGHFCLARRFGSLYFIMCVVHSRKGKNKLRDGEG